MTVNVAGYVGAAASVIKSILILFNYYDDKRVENNKNLIYNY